MRFDVDRLNNRPNELLSDTADSVTRAALALQDNISQDEVNFAEKMSLPYAAGVIF